MTPRERAVLAFTLLLVGWIVGSFLGSSSRASAATERMKELEAALQGLGIDSSVWNSTGEAKDGSASAPIGAHPIAPTRVEDRRPAPPARTPLPARQPPPLPPRADLPLSQWKTTWKCYTRDDLTEICTYKDFCYDGQDLIFLDPGKPRGQPPDDLIGPERLTNFEYVYWDPAPYPPPTSQYAAFQSMYAEWAHQPLLMNPSDLEEKANTVEFIEGGFYFAPAERNTENLWHASMESFSLWDMQMLNETLPYHAKLPPMDYVVIHRRTIVLPGWQRMIMRAMVQPQTQFLNLQWFQASSFDFSKWDGSIYALSGEYVNFPFTPYQKKNFNPKPRKNNQFPVDKANVICAREGVIASQKPRLFSGWQSAQMYREKLFDMLGVPMPAPKGIESGSTKPNFSGKVLIDFRGWAKSRNWINHNVFAEMVRYYGLTPVVIESYSKFDDYESQQIGRASCRERV